jgi:hypothetical protein
MSLLEAGAFEMAMTLLDRGYDTITIAKRLVGAFGLSEDEASAIIALAWGP